MDKWDLYLVTEEELSAGRSTLEVVKEALAGGVDVVQLREKSLTSRERYNLGQKVRELTSKAGVDFIINDSVDLALALKADGVHLGDDDLPVKEARKLMGADKIIGMSTSNLEEVNKAREDGADYVGFGAIYRTTSKDVKDCRQSIGLERLKRVSKQVKIPIVAIGGINKRNAVEVIEAGADAVAVISAISRAEDIKERTKKLKRLIQGGS